MKIFFIYFVTYISGVKADEFGANSQIELMTDMSTTCIDDLHTNIYLTFGMGVSDSVVIIISDNDLYPNCEITFYTVGGNNAVYLILVVEFPDHTEGLKNACQDSNSNIYIDEPNMKQEINVCNEVNKLQFGYFTTPVYSIITGSENVSIKIVSKSLFETVKLTATSARRLSQYERCDNLREVPCIISNFSVCISRELLCDENINCGGAAANDEDVRICDEGRYKRLWLVVSCGTIMIIIIVFFLIHLLKTCLPAVPDTFFIFNEDEDNKLILSTQFTAPRELIARSQLQQHSSTYRFRSISISHPQPINIPTIPKLTHKKTRTSFEKDRATLESVQNEIELESQTYKHETSKEIEGLINITPTTTTLTKKPRFQRDIINIMDYIDQQAYYSDDETQLPRQTDSKIDSNKESVTQKRPQAEEQLISKREKKNEKRETRDKKEEHHEKKERGNERKRSAELQKYKKRSSLD